MIQRNVDVNDLSKFDFFNDAKDTIEYLLFDRPVEAKKLQEAYEIWLEKTFKILDI